MKLLALSLMLLWLVGCSHDMSTGPQDQESATLATALSDVSPEAVPVNDIEPEVPACETNHTGFVELTNRGTRPVTCMVGDNHTFNVAAGQVVRYEIPMGAYDVSWHVGQHTCYTTDEIVPMCKTLKLSFEPKLAVRAIQAQ